MFNAKKWISLTTHILQVVSFVHTETHEKIVFISQERLFLADFFCFIPGDTNFLLQYRALVGNLGILEEKKLLVISSKILVLF